MSTLAFVYYMYCISTRFAINLSVNRKLFYFSLIYVSYIGSGEPDIDGLEVNPFLSKRQKQEWEVKALLEKIPSDLIVLEPHQITKVNTGRRTIVSSKEINFEKQKVIFIIIVCIFAFVSFYRLVLVSLF